MTCLHQVTGNYKTVDWSKIQDWWVLLRVWKFPEPPADPIVDVLIGRDHTDLHFCKFSGRGISEELIVNCPERSTMKTRIIFDARAKFQSTSLKCPCDKK